MNELPKPTRHIPRDLQVKVFQRDHWICQWCGRPVIFAPAMKYLELFGRQSGFVGLAYHDERWRRDRAPLLDELGAVVDHVNAHSCGGLANDENLATACNKCNSKKSNSSAEEHSKRSPRHVVKGKYGQPRDWDGLCTLFVILVERTPKTASASERDWLRHLKPAQLRHSDLAHCL